MEVLRKLDVLAVEQVIAVPLISLDRVPQRSVIRRPQKAEQLVEVPTEPGYSLAVIAVQATVWRAAAAMEHIVDFGGGAAEVFQVYEQDRVQQRQTWNRSMSFLFLRVGVGMMEVLKVLSQNRIQQLRMWSRSSIFKLVEVSKVFAKAEVLHQVDFFVT